MSWSLLMPTTINAPTSECQNLSPKSKAILSSIWKITYLRMQSFEVVGLRKKGIRVRPMGGVVRPSNDKHDWGRHVRSRTCCTFLSPQKRSDAPALCLFTRGSSSPHFRHPQHQKKRSRSSTPTPIDMEIKKMLNGGVEPPTFAYHSVLVQPSVR